MKRYGNLFEKVIDFDNLHLAYKKASRTRRYKWDVLRFTDRLEENLIQLQNELIWGQYQPGRYKVFTIFEPKERQIYAAAFRDRVLHHAIMNVLEPIWDKLMISDTYACRKGRGTHAASERLVSFIRSAEAKFENAYCLKCDIRKFFPSINLNTLMRVVEQKIKCGRILSLLRSIVFVEADVNDPAPCNMPIGNLISQWCANLYLGSLDWFIKHVLKCRYYLRYMDDFILLHNNKEQLHDWLAQIERFLRDELQLELNRKTSIFPVSQGIDFVGYRTWADFRLLRKSSSKRISANLHRLVRAKKLGLVSAFRIGQAARSWIAHCKHSRSFRVRKRVLSTLWARMNGACRKGRREQESPEASRRNLHEREQFLARCGANPANSNLDDRG